jgi:hypothetical protein
LFNPQPFPGQNPPQQQNIPEIAPKPGQNSLPQQNILILPRFHGQNTPPLQNIPKIPPKHGGNLLPQQNILISATKPGQTATAGKKCPGNTPKTGRKCIFTQKKVTWMSPLLPLADLGIVRWGLAVLFQRIQLGAEKGICRMLHQRI